MSFSPGMLVRPDEHPSGYKADHQKNCSEDQNPTNVTGLLTLARRRYANLCAVTGRIRIRVLKGHG